MKRAFLFLMSSTMAAIALSVSLSQSAFAQGFEVDPQTEQMAIEVLEQNPALVLQLVQTALQQNPQLLQYLEQNPEMVMQVVQQNPQLLQYLQQNPQLVEQFEQMLQE